MTYDISFEPPDYAVFESAVGILISFHEKKSKILDPPFQPKKKIFENFRFQKKLKPLYEEAIGISFVALGPVLRKSRSILKQTIGYY